MSVNRVPALRRPRLEDRLAPYLRDTSAPSRLLRIERALTPFPTMERILAPFMADAGRLGERGLGGSGAQERRPGAVRDDR
ncbi:MAG: type II secretion system protein F, partial [Cryobacterium sp.]|nr:type II secretion system protein F [Cryobacterium sp.]